MEYIDVKLSSSQVRNLIEWFELEFINYVRKDVEIENLEYLVSMCDIYCELKRALAVKKGVSNESNTNY